MQVDFSVVGGTPCYVLKTLAPAASSIHGASLDRDNARWLYPAYAPFEERVFHDINIAFKGIAWSQEALGQHAASVEAERAMRAGELPAGFTYKTKPFAHQAEGLSFIYHRLRAALLWDMGTGKSKPIVDLKRLLPKERMLIVTPKVTLYNWKREFEVHGEPGIKVGVIAGTLAQKRKVMQFHRDYDVLVCSYGTARNMGFPVLQKDTLEAIQAAKADATGRKMSLNAFEALIAVCRQVSGTEDQLSFVKRWSDGEAMAALDRAARAMRAQTTQYLGDMDYQIIIPDESHNLQSNTSDQTKAVKALGRRARRRVIMSGTVALGDPMDVFAQMQLLSTALVPEDYLKYQDMFLVKSEYNKHQVLGYKNLHLLNERLDRVASRKTRAECITLPERQIFDVTFELEGAQKTLYNTLIKENGADLAAMFAEGNITLEMANKAVLLNKLGQVCSGFILEPIDTGVCTGCVKLAQCVTENIKPYTSRCTEAKGSAPTREVMLGPNPKLALLEELLEQTLVNPVNKAIVWAQHTAELGHIEVMLKRRGWGHVRVDGSTGTRIQANIDKFNNDPACRVYVSQVATGIGITLNSANYTFYYSLPWSLGEYLQSNDRNYRIGQKNNVVVYRLFGAGTVELVKAQVLQDKAEVTSTITSKLACSACPQQATCAKENVELFDANCIHQRSVRRTIAKAKELL